MSAHKTVFAVLSLALGIQLSSALTASSTQIDTLKIIVARGGIMTVTPLSTNGVPIVNPVTSTCAFPAPSNIFFPTPAYISCDFKYDHFTQVIVKTIPSPGFRFSSFKTAGYPNGPACPNYAKTPTECGFKLEYGQNVYVQGNFLQNYIGY